MLWLAVALAIAPARASAAPPRGGPLPGNFFGIAAGVDLFDGRIDLDGQLSLMRAAGTESIRFPLYWSAAQPYRSWRDVPAAMRGQFVTAGGRPTTFTELDRQILTFGGHGLQMLPVILQAPPWARVDPAKLWSPPARPQAYAAFVGAVVRRYGTRGTFWAAHPQLARLAPRWWQIWNEPAGGDTPEGETLFWDGPKPYEPRYLAMVRRSRRAARRADPRSRIVLAGLFGDSWDALSRLYAHGAEGLFDAVAVHPYANTPAHVLAILRRVHLVLAARHQRRLPLLVTETGWTSSRGLADPGNGAIQSTAAGQASNLAAEYSLLVGHRRALNLGAIFWYTWLGTEPSSDPFEYAGLLALTPDGRVAPKPALRSYERTLARLEG